METTEADKDSKQDMEDSGCIEDAAARLTDMDDERFSILDLCDDVLLHILKFCTPRTLKALGYTCLRLGRLVQRRSLWRHVDCSMEPCSVKQLQWYLGHTIRDDVETLLINGHAKASADCSGIINAPRRSEDKGHDLNISGLTPPIMEDNISVMRELRVEDLARLPRLHANARVTYLPRYRGTLTWPDDKGRLGPHNCKGPQYSFNQKIMKYLRDEFTCLTTLGLDYCNINCSFINLASFPRFLRSLSLCGTKLFNLYVERSFLTKINEFLPALE
ncbi:unnamed protein product, partial [Leptidea sinapis]